MSGGSWSGVLVFFISGFLAVNTKLDLDSSLRLAHCRASCLFKIRMFNMSDSLCDMTQPCKQCWDTCQPLQGDKHSLRYCKRPTCGGGCREACRYWQLTARPPVLLSRHEEVLYSSTQDLVQWPPLEPDAPPAVYVVLDHGKPHSQTLDTRVNLSLETLEEVRVLRVDWRGQTTVMGPQLESSLDRLRTVLQTLGMAIPPQANLTTHLKSGVAWQLKQEWAVRQQELVSVRISWEQQSELTKAAADPPRDQLMYLVTWQEDGEEDDGVRGNMLTNTTSVTISLQPDMLYRIQVSITNVNLEGGQSEPLVVNTHDVHTASTQFSSTLHPASASRAPSLLDSSVSPAPDSLPQPARVDLAIPQHSEILTLPRVDLVACGVASFTALLLLLVLSTAWRCRHRFSFPHSTLVIDDDDETPSLYRVFSPAVRLVGEKQPDLYTSTDNLLQH